MKLRIAERLFILKNQQGMTLIEVMVATALLGGLSMAGMYMFKTQMTSQRTVETNYEITGVTGEIRTLLGSQDNCSATFLGINPSNGTVNKMVKVITSVTDPVGSNKDFFPTGVAFRNGIKINSYVFDKTFPNLSANETMLKITYSRGISAATDVTQKLVKIIYPTVDGSGNILTCYATSGSGGAGAGDDDASLWIASTVNPNDIYDNTGNVGIGTDNPIFPLDVVGTNPATSTLMRLRSSWSTGGGVDNPGGPTIRLQNTRAGVGETYDIRSSQSGFFQVQRITDGTSVMSIAPNGNVGFNNSSPQAALHLGSKGATTSEVRFNHGAAGATVELEGSDIGWYGGFYHTNSKTTGQLKLDQYKGGTWASPIFGTFLQHTSPAPGSVSSAYMGVRANGGGYVTQAPVTADTMRIEGSTTDSSQTALHVTNYDDESILKIKNHGYFGVLKSNIAFFEGGTYGDTANLRDPGGWIAAHDTVVSINGNGGHPIQFVQTDDIVGVVDPSDISKGFYQNTGYAIYMNNRGVLGPTTLELENGGVQTDGSANFEQMWARAGKGIIFAPNDSNDGSNFSNIAGVWSIDGYLGIGTNAPDVGLTLFGPLDSLKSKLKIGVGVNNSYMMGQNADGQFVFDHDLTVGLPGYIFRNGKVGFNTYGIGWLQASLEVYASASTSTIMSVGNNSNANNGVLWVDSYGAGGFAGVSEGAIVLKPYKYDKSGYSDLCIRASMDPNHETWFKGGTGYVGLGKNSPAYQWDQIGSANFAGTVTASGVLLSSDKRLKKDFENLDSPLEKILSLQGYTFKWDDRIEKNKQRPTTTQLGLIAQEVQKVYPEAVEKNKDGYFMVNYPSLLAPLVEAIKELAAKVRDYTKDLLGIKEEIAELRQENKELRNYLCKRKPASKSCLKRP